MNPIEIDQQFHGYRRGHQLLKSTCRISRGDQDVLTYLSDLSGPLEPGQTFAPYLTGYPLPSGDYYVLAKTWQDLDVERAGCVYTRSFLISMAEWVEIDNVARLIGELGTDRKPTIDEHKHAFFDKKQLIEPVDDARSAALAKALFLQEKSPVAWFGPTQSEPIVMRVLQSEKSTLRRNFSFCTYSLAPRSIDGVPLSLQFAPVVSRSRFSRWSGQKIGNDQEVVSFEQEPELKALVDSVFLAEEPDIRSIDHSGIFWRGDFEQEVPIRIVMLWNQMLREAVNSPAALLGLLDISSTLGKLAPSALGKLKPIIQDWLLKLPINVSEENNFDFLSSFFAKIRDTNVEFWSDLPLREAVSSAVVRAPRLAIQKLTPTLERSSWIFNLVMSSIGDGLLKLDSNELSLVLQKSLPKNRVFDLLLSSHKIAQSIADTDVLDDPDLAVSFETYSEGLVKSDASTLRSIVLAALWKKEHIPLFRAAIDSSDQDLILTALVKLFRNGRPIAPEFDKLLLSNRITVNILPSLQLAVLETSDTPEAERFVTSSIIAQPSTLKILLGLGERSSDRLRSIVEYLLRDNPDDILWSLFDYGDNSVVAAQIAERLVVVAPKTALSLLSLIKTPSTYSVEAAFHCFELAEESTSDEAAFQSVRFAVQLDGSSADDVLKSIRGFSLNEQQASKLRFVQRDYSSKLIERNLQFMAKSWRNTSSKFPFDSGQIFPPLISHGLETFSPKLWKNIGAILEKISSRNQNEFEENAENLLGAALELTDSNVSGLLELTFPIVHSALKRKRLESSMFSLFYYTDFDRCKTARTELVRAYMRSGWPEESLLKIAVNIHEINSIFDIVRWQYGGERYMNKLVDSVDRLPNRVRKEIEGQI